MSTKYTKTIQTKLKVVSLNGTYLCTKQESKNVFIGVPAKNIDQGSFGKLMRITVNGPHDTLEVENVITVDWVRGGAEALAKSRPSAIIPAVRRYEEDAHLESAHEDAQNGGGE